MAAPIWQQSLQPASFNGVAFHVEVQAKASGRRIVPFEFPKQDAPYTEDMGRRIRRFTVTAYIIYSPSLTPDYEGNRNDLIDALETEGPGQLVLPTGLSWMLGGNNDAMVMVDTYSVTERRERGGYCEFEMTFIEAGQANFSSLTTSADTQSQVNNQADQSTVDFQNSSDIVSI